LYGRQSQTDCVTGHDDGDARREGAGFFPG
jgi:hypothetical protein